MNIGAMARGLRGQLAGAARRVVQTACERIALLVRERTTRVDSSAPVRDPAVVSRERWGICERVDARVAVRDENGLLIVWVLPEDAALVAAAPALLDALRDVVELADDDPEWRSHEDCLRHGRALVRELDDGNGAPSDNGSPRRGVVHG